MKPTLRAIAWASFGLLWVGFSTPLPAQATSGRGIRALADLSAAFEELAEKTSRAVVQVNVSGYAIVPESHGDVAALTKEKGVGSGVILSADGYIVTNAHVVHGAQRVTVTFHGTDAQPAAEDVTTSLPARVIGTDTDTDLALLKVDRSDLPFLALGDSDRVRQGEIVIAFGSPLGLTNSMTMGMVSAPVRQLDDEAFVQYIQTDAAINPGNSGGPLVDTKGEVIGINAMILTQSGGNEGVGLAIPTNVVRSVVEQLKVQGHVHRGMIGVTAQPITPALSEGLGVPESGVLVSDLAEGGPADQAGLHIGDVVTKIDDTPLRSARQLEQVVFRASAGDVVRLLVNSEGEEKTISVTVAERKDAEDNLASLVDPKDSLVPQLGVLGLTLDPATSALLPSLREKTGVLVAAQTHEPTAWTSQLEPGDVIHEINGSAVTTTQFLREKIASIAPGKAVVLQVERDGTMQYLALRAE